MATPITEFHKERKCIICGGKYLITSGAVKVCSGTCREKKNRRYALKWKSENKEDIRQYKNGYVEKDIAIKNPARQLVNHYVKIGKIIRPNVCEDEECIKGGKLEAHHPFGYEGENKLNVVFLCSKHHHKQHAKTRT